MARPSISGPSIVVSIDGDVLVWTDGHLTGENKEHIKAAKWLSSYGIPVEVNRDGLTIEAQLDNPENQLGALAAMLGVIPDRGRILEAPSSLMDHIRTDDDEPVYSESEPENYESKVTLPDGTVLYSMP